MPYKILLAILSLLSFFFVDLHSQLTGVMPWFDAGNNFGEVQDSVYNRDPIFAFQLESDSSIIIDGNLDPSWDLYPVFPINRVSFDIGTGYNPAPSREDFTAETRFTWDDDNLYILVIVLDDTIVETQESVRFMENRRDLIDFYFGPHFPYNPDRVGTDIEGLGHWAWNLDDGDRQYQINCGSDSIYETRSGFVQVANETVGSHAANIDFKYVNHDSLYIMEIKVPWTSAFGIDTVEAGDFFSFDLAAEDVDTEGNERSHKIAINSLWNNVYAWRFYSGKLTLLPAIYEQSNQEIVSISPLNTNGQQPITITLDPSLACSPEWDSANLVGVPRIGMHSSAVLVGEPDVAWNHWVAWDGSGFDGSSPVLTPNGDGTYSITLTPSEFYGTGDAPVKGISMVFNNGSDWTQSARAFSVNGCKDLYTTLSDIPVNASALLLDGLDDYFVLNSVVDDMLEDNSEYTFECWIKPQSPGKVFSINYGNGDNDNNFSYLFSDRFAYWNNGHWEGTGKLGLNNWYHFAVSMEMDDHARFYINGMEVKSFYDDTRIVTGSTFNVGMNHWLGETTEHINAIIDNVMIWNKARTAEEIQLDLQSSTSPLDENLIAWYTFEDISNSVVFDNSTFNNLGILNGDPRLVPSYGNIFGAPATPIDLSGFPSQNSIAVTWLAETSLPGENYNIYIEDVYNGTSVSPQFRITGLQPETSYNIYVAAVNPITYEESEKALLAMSTLSLTPVLPATSVPIVDGIVDDVWKTLSTSNVLNKFALGEPVPETDFSVKFRTMWDQDALYFLAEVNDDSLVSGAPLPFWEQDGMEIYLDRENEKIATGGYDDNDVQLRFIFNDSVVAAWYNGHPAWIDVPAIEFQDTVTAEGYNIEIKFPWIALQMSNPSDGTQLGVEVTVNDNDGTGRESIIAWNAIADDAWNNPGVWGTVVLVTEDSTLNLFLNKDDSHSDIPEGRAEVNVQGGSPPYAYLWSTGDTTQGVRNLYPGTYTVTVTDNKGNSKLGSVIIQNLGSYYSNCLPGFEEIEVTVKTDNIGGETQWDLRVADSTFYTVPYETYGNNTLYSTNVCVPADEQLTFTIRDYGGDGICCINGNGYYKVESSCAVLVSGDEFSSFESETFTITGLEDQAEFSHIIGDPGFQEGIKTIQTCEGQFAALGNTDSEGAGKKDLLFVKMNGVGDTLWTTTLGTSDAEIAVDILQASDGGFLLLAEQQSTSNRYPMLVKTDAGGDEMWTKTFMFNTDLRPKNVIEVSDGYMMVASEGINGTAHFLKVDNAGDSVFAFTDDANPMYLIQASDDGLVTLFTDETLGNKNVEIRKYDVSGTVQWTKIIDEADHQVGFSFAETYENEYIISGESYSDGNDPELYVLKLDNAGNKIWSKTYGAGTTPSIAETSTLEYIVAANRNNDAGLLKLDPNGDILWEKSFGKTADDYRLNYVALTSDNGYIATGRVTDQTFIPDLWVFRTNAEGYGCFSKPFEEENICLVTIDSDTEKNMVVWEKTEDVGTGFYRIFRETTVANEYIEIGMVTQTDYSQYVDMGSEPRTQAHRYKISLIDTCGNESEMSDFHQPIHLQVSKNTGGGHNLDWSLYELESDDLNFKTHLIYGGTDSISMQVIDSVSGNVNKYTDTRTVSRKTRYYYRVEGVLFDACAPTGDVKKAGTGPYSHSLSNLDDNKLKASPNSAPTDISMSNDNVDENQPAGILVAILTTDDQDTLDTHVYSFVSGTGDDNNSDFTIQGDSVLSSRIFDFESETSLNIRVETKDDGADTSLTYVRTFAISVNDVVGIQPNGYGPVTLYPNPMTQSTTVRFRNTGNHKYTLYLRDVAGKLIRTIDNINSDKVLLERNGLKPGYYSIEVSGPETFRGKLIIR